MAGVVVDPTQPGPPQRLPSLMAALMAAVSSVTGRPVSLHLLVKQQPMPIFLPYLHLQQLPTS